MASPVHLVDTSVLMRQHQPAVLSALAGRAVAGRIGICAPVMYEVGYAARNGESHAELLSELDRYPWVPTSDADHRRALELQGELARTGRHRALSLVDALVAAVAEARELIVLHYDADFELVSEITGQAHEWIVERGSAD